MNYYEISLLRGRGDEAVDNADSVEKKILRQYSIVCQLMYCSYVELRKYSS
jgi:hypothetical protein